MGKVDEFFSAGQSSPKSKSKVDDFFAAGQTPAKQEVVSTSSTPDIGQMAQNLGGAVTKGLWEAPGAISQFLYETPGNMMKSAQKEIETAQREGLSYIPNAAAAMGAGIDKNLTGYVRGGVNLPSSIANTATGTKQYSSGIDIPEYGINAAANAILPGKDVSDAEMRAIQDAHPFVGGIGEYVLDPTMLVPATKAMKAAQGAKAFTKPWVKGMVGASAQGIGLGAGAGFVNQRQETPNDLETRITQAGAGALVGGTLPVVAGAGLGALGKVIPEVQTKISGGVVDPATGQVIHSAPPLESPIGLAGLRNQAPEVLLDATQPVPVVDQPGIAQLPEQTAQQRLALTPEETGTQLELDTRVESPILDAQGNPIMKDPAGQLAGEPLQLPEAQQRIPLETPDPQFKQGDLFELDPPTPERITEVTTRANTVLEKVKAGKIKADELINVVREVHETGLTEKVLREKLKSFTQKQLDALGKEVGC